MSPRKRDRAPLADPWEAESLGTCEDGLCSLSRCICAEELFRFTTGSACANLNFLWERASICAITASLLLTRRCWKAITNPSREL
ncbi:hypothetical protein SKAU_G00155660 [Synaphobranchus kaupii]|uniref:Uncharacterized protein n=1 Tax=Synaphobranchus kaupii TaxID=118154 RepID=A0A9Q1IYC0_SYNKA|nr:hypothetical protein SKAU_G00155660 [Synaphobranchus kaupii]